MFPSGTGLKKTGRKDAFLSGECAETNLVFYSNARKTSSFCSPQPQTARRFLNAAENVPVFRLQHQLFNGRRAQSCAEPNRCNALDSLLVRAREEMQNPEERRGTSIDQPSSVGMSGHVGMQVHRRPLLSDSVLCLRRTALFHSCSSSAGGWEGGVGASLCTVKF